MGRVNVLESRPKLAVVAFSENRTKMSSLASSLAKRLFESNSIFESISEETVISQYREGSGVVNGLQETISWVKKWERFTVNLSILYPLYSKSRWNGNKFGKSFSCDQA